MVHVMYVSLSLESLLFLNALTHTQLIIMTVYPSLTVNALRYVVAVG